MVCTLWHRPPQQLHLDTDRSRKGSRGQGDCPGRTSVRGRQVRCSNYDIANKLSSAVHFNEMNTTFVIYTCMLCDRK